MGQFGVQKFVCEGPPAKEELIVWETATWDYGQELINKVIAQLIEREQALAHGDSQPACTGWTPIDPPTTVNIKPDESFLYFDVTGRLWPLGPGGFVGSGA